MAFAAGAKLGPYEIVAPLGAGGMGEVYRARDTRLDRDVAIKVSAERFSERFEREAKAIAALNHPNVCTLHDVGPNYLVMELVEGPTLADRIAQGPIPLTEALNIARQIADALEAAHEKGITHRDLKPANVKIAGGGMVKVLDFGLAKVASVSPQGEGNASDSPTISMAATQAGVILGTAAYMSPEQASGKPVDQRADIWSFGVVLFEMLSGKKVFAGETVSHTLAEVLIKDPDWSRLPAGTPPGIRRLLRRCLERDLKRRLRDIGSARLEMEDALAGEEPVLQTLPASQPRKPALRILWPALAGVLAMVAGVALWAPWRSEKPADKPLVRLDAGLGTDAALAPFSATHDIAISPDGTRLAYRAGSPAALFTRKLDQANAVELSGTRGAKDLFFSPDSRWIGFTVAGKLYKISVEGGAVVRLSEIQSQIPGASWGDDGTIVVSGGVGKGLLRVPSAGGPPAVLTELTKGETAHAFPQVLPGGKAVLFVASSGPGGDSNLVEVFTFADRRRKIVARGGYNPRYLSSGHLVYANKATLFAVRFDLDKLEPRGTPVPVLDDLAFAAPFALVQYDAAQNGTLIYRKGNPRGSEGTMIIQWVDPAGNQVTLLAKPAAYKDPRLSPDGKRLALSIGEESGSSIWVYDTQRDAMQRLTSGPSAYPVWSPDGQFVVFATPDGFSWTRADGSTQPQLLKPDRSFPRPVSFSPDGRRLAYVESATKIWTLPIDVQGAQLKAGTPELFSKSQFADQEPTFSPDGRWLAYRSAESGQNEIWVRPFPPPASGPGGKWQVSDNGGTGGVSWSRVRNELVYRSGDRMMAVSYTVKGDAFQADKPRVWIAKLGGTTPQLAPDGKRVAVLAPASSSQRPPEDNEVVFLQNFFDELKRKVPVGK